MFMLQHHAQDFGHGGSGHAVAWAFLRLQGLRQQQLQGEPLRLQLYRYKPGGADWQHLLVGKVVLFKAVTVSYHVMMR
jgi:hypothetical protein